MVRVAFASLLTLGLIGAMAASILAVALFLIGALSFGLVLLLTGIFFLFSWLLSPWISDHLYQWFYGLQWIGIEGVREKDAKLADFVEQLCEKHGLKVPKIGFIPDNNPQAFAYGSGKWNARMVFTQGILTYCDTNERKAVLAHELGHVRNNDFIVMTIASFLVTLLYELSQVFLRSGEKSSGSKKGGGGFLVVVGIVSYVFYIIGTYLLLFLSRTREYLADEFSAAEHDANALSTALVKIAYGIVAEPDSAKTTRLVQSTRTLGIYDFHVAKNFGLNYMDYQQTGKWDATEKAIAYDMHSIWAYFGELSSSHPLTGKRLLRLSEFATEARQKALFDFRKILAYPVDRSRLLVEFLRDLTIIYLPIALALVSFLAGVFVFESIFTAIAMALVFLGVGSLAKALYSYPSGGFTQTTVEDLMGDVYASPVRGTPVKLDGKVVGRGVPGMIASEDMMFQDATGLIYLNFESIIPFIGNLWFALKKVEPLIGSRAQLSGWFVRSLGQQIILDELSSPALGESVKSRQRTWAFIAGFLWIVLGIGVKLLTG